MPRPYPREFREDVVRVARNREPGVGIKDIAADFGISESCLTNWLTAADVEDGIKPGTTADDDPLYRSRRLLTKGHERLDTRGEAKLLGLLEAGDPRGEVHLAWHAN